MRFNGPFLSVLNGRWGLIPIRLILAAGSCMLVPVLLASPSRAQPIPLPGGGYQIDLNKTINGASPAGSGPWLSLQITDIGTPGSGGVSILFTPSLAPTEFITKVGLNLTQAFQAANPNPFANLSVSCDPAIGGGLSAPTSIL